MSKHQKYVPKHRSTHTPTAPAAVGSAARTGLRKSIVLSSVALVATGVAVASGVVSTTTPAPGEVTNVATDLSSVIPKVVKAEAADEAADGAADGAGAGTETEAAERPTRAPQVSRSDRRAASDPDKEAALDAGTTDSNAVTGTEDASDEDPREIARALMPEFGFGPDQWNCLDQLYISESDWRIDADNPTSSAYGIPQALPGSKMASAGSDWETNPVTQIRWGLGYIKDSYGTPCSAWSFKQGNNWY